MTYNWKKLLTDTANSYMLEQCRDVQEVFRLRPTERGTAFYGTIGDMLRYLETRSELVVPFGDELFMGSLYSLEGE